MLPLFEEATMRNPGWLEGPQYWTDQPAGDDAEFDRGYCAMAQDEARETEALELSEATVGDSLNLR